MVKKRPKLIDTVIIGAGISGLGLAQRLSRAGQKPLLLEAGPEAGGLAGGLRLGGQAIERYYHYLCPADTELLSLAGALGVQSRFTVASQATWMRGWRPLNHAGNLLSLPLGFGAKARLAWGSLGLGGEEPGLGDDGLEARAWLDRRFGAEASSTLFRPLIDGKFGRTPLSASWIRHRLWRSRQGAGWRGPRAGSFSGGYAAFFAALIGRLRLDGAQIRFNHPVRSLRPVQGGWELRSGGVAPLRARRVLAAVPAPRLLQMLGPVPRRSPWARSLGTLRWRALVQPVFALKRPVSPHFWNNLGPGHSPFNGLIQYERLRSVPFSLAYLPAYVDAASPWLRRSDAAVLSAAFRLLRSLQPALTDGDLIEAAVSREALAQPVLPPGSGSRTPSMHADLPGLHWLDACHLHPADRSLEACLRAGRRLLEELPAHA
jgi:protoporphyrinogen oxidase